MHVLNIILGRFRGGSVGSVHFLKSGVCSSSTSDREGGERSGEEIQSLRERTRWTADTVGVHITLRQKNVHGATFIFPYIIRHLPPSPIKISSPSRVAVVPSPTPLKEHVTILIEARHNSDGSGATARFYRRDSSRRVAIKRSANISRHFVPYEHLKSVSDAAVGYSTPISRCSENKRDGFDFSFSPTVFPRRFAGFTENYWSFKFKFAFGKSARFIGTVIFLQETDFIPNEKQIFNFNATFSSRTVQFASCYRQIWFH